jgi:oligopeptide/dipeptide ABC transporter ATP-binding protein
MRNLTDSQSQLSESKRALEIRNLRVVFRTYAGIVKAIDGIDLTVYRHELLGLVGESGCGKSVTALAIAGLLPENADIQSGEILLDGENLLRRSKQELRLSRLTDIALVFQDPMTYLNPVISVGTQLTDAFYGNLKVYKKELVDFRLSQIERELMTTTNDKAELQSERERLVSLRENSDSKLGRREGRRLARLRAIEYLKLVQLPEPERVMKNYPFELSGGMRQRVMIAMALIRRPKVLLADEITTALDVTIQAQILKLVQELRDKIDSAVVIITHDLGVVAQVCDRVAVMYAGNIVELASVDEMFRNPMHPYTRGLFAAIPKLHGNSKEDLESIKGSVPDLIYPPGGCRFHPRCPLASEQCQEAKPTSVEVSPGHLVWCLSCGREQTEGHAPA